MCETCDHIQRNIKLNKMTTTQIFSEFDSLVNSGKIDDLGLVDPKSSRRVNRFVCKSCSTKWLFALPDHAFKGELKRE